MVNKLVSQTSIMGDFSPVLVSYIGLGLVECELSLYQITLAYVLKVGSKMKKLKQR